MQYVLHCIIDHSRITLIFMLHILSMDAGAKFIGNVWDNKMPVPVYLHLLRILKYFLLVLGIMRWNGWIGEISKLEIHSEFLFSTSYSCTKSINFFSDDQFNRCKSNNFGHVTVYP